MADPRLITLVCASPPLTVTALRGQVAPRPEGGFGGWSQVTRPRRKALTQWDGIAPFAQVFSLMLDGYPDTSVEDDCGRIEKMALANTAGDEPPIVRVVGAVVHAELAYIIDSLDWDPAPIWNRGGFRTRQEVTVHLLEYVADDRLQEAPAAERARRFAAATAAAGARKSGSSNQPPRAKVYVVKTGDTLSSIAAHLLGSYKRWQELATLNNIRDPRALKTGQTLRLP